jgi:hypothetical protein
MSTLWRFGVTAPLIVAASVGAGPMTAQDGPVADVVIRVGRYVERYGTQMSVVIGVEHYSQTERDPKVVRALVSEIALVRVNNDWLGYRDVMEVDGKPVADRSRRLKTLFLETPSTAIEQGRRIADESARYNLGGILRNFNMPTTALLVLQPSNQHRFRFTHVETATRGGTTVWKLEYKEVTRPTLIKTSAGKEMPVTGHAWVLPDDGTVVETELAIASTSTVFVTSSRASGGPERQAGEFKTVPSRARITVTYQRDPRLDLMVPAEMREVYERVGFERRQTDTSADVTHTTECRAVYSDFKRFETSAALTLPK